MTFNVKHNLQLPVSVFGKRYEPVHDGSLTYSSLNVLSERRSPLLCFRISSAYIQYMHNGSFNPKMSPQTDAGPCPITFHQEAPIIHEGSQHPRRVMFPLLQPYTSKLIHRPQYSESQSNKGVALRLTHSSTHSHRASTVHVKEYNCWSFSPVFKVTASCRRCLVFGEHFN